ncbi:MAG: hypothetical protein NT011_12145 [Kiritimatiellaeota bacterium]|nr:hypothetical protein [Kiritimatiellota bacterium]
MKTIITGLCLIALAATTTIAAAPVQALVNDEEANWGFFIRPELKITPIKNQTTELAGGILGTSVGRALYLGVGGYTLVNSVSTDSGAMKLKAFDIWYAGAHADYTLFSTELFHGSLSGFAGGGQVNNSAATTGSDSANLFIAEPDINLEFNLTSTLELGAGIGYRFVNGSDLDKLTNADLSSWVGTVFLRWTEG